MKLLNIFLSLCLISSASSILALDPPPRPSTPAPATPPKTPPSRPATAAPLTKCPALQVMDMMKIVKNMDSDWAAKPPAAKMIQDLGQVQKISSGTLGRDHCGYTVTGPDNKMINISIMPKDKK